MDGYVGDNVQAVRLSDAAARMRRFPRPAPGCSGALRDMIPANGGNISASHGDGMVISAPGANPDCLEPKELIHVTGSLEDDEHVRCHGSIESSAETIMHWLIHTLLEKYFGELSVGGV